jgi:Sap, sulfolipid-1-addressing protein
VARLPRRQALTELYLTLVPLGLFVALSPVSIVAVILLLGTKHPLLNPLAFAVGWMAAIFVIGVIGLAVLSGEDFSPDSTGRTGVAALELAVGVALLIGAFRMLRQVPAEPPADQAQPGWMSRIEGLKPPTALIAGAVLFIVNLGDVMVALVATATILKAEVSTSESVVALVVFTAVASVTIIGPVVLYAAAPTRSAAVLESWKAWLSVPRNTMIAVFVLIGVLLIINGLRDLV